MSSYEVLKFGCCNGIGFGSTVEMLLWQYMWLSWAEAEQVVSEELLKGKGVVTATLLYKYHVEKTFGMSHFLLLTDPRVNAQRQLQ